MERERTERILKDIHRELEALTEPAYAKFSASLMRKPGEKELSGSAASVMGVRLPALHKLAKKLAQGNWRETLEAFEAAGKNGAEGNVEVSENLNSPLCFEERLLWGFLIGEVTSPGGSKRQGNRPKSAGAKCEAPADKLELVRAFLPQIDNWSVCDSFCAGLKFAKKFPEETWGFLQPLFRDENTYVVRFAVVMCINHFITEEYVDKLLLIFDEIVQEDYYVKMAVAWAVSICYVKFPGRTQRWLEGCRLDVFTHNKALQKIVESRCVDEETKAKIRKMKRSARLK